MRRQPMLALSAAIGLTVACGGGFLSRAARAENDPVYVVKNGEVDQHVYNGFRRYGEACLRCHGPDGAGSSYAPNLTESLKRLSYDDVVNVIINGRKNVNSANNNVMPSFGTTEDSEPRRSRRSKTCSAVFYRALPRRTAVRPCRPVSLLQPGSIVERLRQENWSISVDSTSLGQA